MRLGLVLLAPLAAAQSMQCSLKAASNLPAGSWCNLTGKKWNSGEGQSFVPAAANLTACAEIAASNPQQASSDNFILGWNPTTKRCSWDTYSQFSLSTDAGNATRFYNSSCWSCSRRCRADGTNHLLNGGFEWGGGTRQPWQIWFDDKLEVKTPGIRSTYAAYMSPIESGHRILSQNVDDICTSRYYRFSFNYQVYNRSSIRVFKFEKFDFTGNDLSSYFQVLNDTAVKTYQAIFYESDKKVYGVRTTSNLKQDALLRLTMDNQAGVGTWARIDNFALTPLSGTFNVSTTNLLRNGDFESNSFSPWELQYNNDKETTIVSPGLGTNSKYGLRTVASSENLEQQLTLQADTPYLLTMRYKASLNKTSNPDKQWNVLVSFSTSLDLRGEQTNSVLLPAGLGTVRVPIFARHAQSKIRVRIECAGVAGYGNCKKDAGTNLVFDDLRLQRITGFA